MPVSVNPGLPWRLLQTWITTFCLHAAALFSRPSWSEIVTTNSQYRPQRKSLRINERLPGGKEMAPPPAPIEYAQEKVRLGKTMFLRPGGPNS